MPCIQCRWLKVLWQGSDGATAQCKYFHLSFFINPIVDELQGPSRGHAFFIGCTNFTRSDNHKNKHLSASILDEVDEHLLKRLFRGENVAQSEENDTEPCSCIVSCRTGCKLKTCRKFFLLVQYFIIHPHCLAHPHVVEGEVVLKPPMVRRECQVKRIIFVPVDPEYRFALVFHPKDVAHNHPLPPITKVPKVVSQRYQECAQAAGTARTVLQVDRGQFQTRH